MEIRKRRMHEPREIKRAKTIKWVAIGEDDFKAEDGDYLLRVEQMSISNWWWCVYYGTDQIASYPNKSTLQKAKNAALFQMNKHKKSLIRKTVNSCQ